MTEQVEVYDNGGESFDRYTVVFSERPEGRGMFYALGMSENPTHPQGFGQHTTAQNGSHLGERIELDDLPIDCRNLVMREF